MTNKFLFNQNKIRVLLLRKLIPIVLTVFLVPTSISVNLTKIATSKLLDIMNSRGDKEAIAFMKLSRLHFTRYLTGNPLLEKSTVGINNYGMPKWL